MNAKYVSHKISLDIVHVPQYYSRGWAQGQSPGNNMFTDIFVDISVHNQAQGTDYRPISTSIPNKEALPIFVQSRSALRNQWMPLGHWSTIEWRH